MVSYVSLAFGRYVVEPVFAPCPAPAALITLVSILGVSEWLFDPSPPYDSGSFTTPASSSLTLRLWLSAAFVAAINCWSVSMASRTQVTLTFIKMLALVLIIIPGIIALVKGRGCDLGLQLLLRVLNRLFRLGKTENFHNGFEMDLLTLDRLPLAFYNGLYAYAGW